MSTNFPTYPSIKENSVLVDSRTNEINFTGLLTATQDSEGKVSVNGDSPQEKVYLGVGDVSPVTATGTGSPVENTLQTLTILPNTLSKIYENINFQTSGNFILNPSDTLTMNTYFDGTLTSSFIQNNVGIIPLSKFYGINQNIVVDDATPGASTAQITTGFLASNPAGDNSTNGNYQSSVSGVDFSISHTISSTVVITNSVLECIYSLQKVWTY